VSGFRYGKEEMVGAPNLPVGYDLLIGAQLPLQATVWIDVTTKLPLKRVLKGMRGSEKISVAETYPRTILNQAVPEVMFTIAKAPK
jgi:hypothetical protein